MKTRLQLKVSAGAKRTEFAGRVALPGGEAWKLRVAAPPVDGKANEAIRKFVAGVAGVRVNAVSIVLGETSSLKVLEIEGMDGEALDRAILLSNEGSALVPNGERHGT